VERVNLCLELCDLLLDALLLLGLAELGAPVLLGLGLPLLLGLLVVALLLLPWVLTDLLVGILVQLLETVSLNVVVDVAAELGLVALLIVVGESLHVLGNVTGEDVLAEGLGIELLAFDVVTGEAVLRVRNEDTTVRAALHGTEDTGTGGGAGETDVQEDLEGAALLTVDLGGLSEGELTVGLLDTDEVLVHLELLEHTAGEQKTGGVGGRPVGQAVGDTVGLELVGTAFLLADASHTVPWQSMDVLCGHEDLVTTNLGVDDLADDVLVGEADDEAVLGRIVLVLGLGDQPLTSVVVGCTQVNGLKSEREWDSTYSCPGDGACT
jgi:hypothetical protein